MISINQVKRRLKGNYMEQQAFPGGMEEHMSNGLLEVTGLTVRVKIKRFYTELI